MENNFTANSVNVPTSQNHFTFNIKHTAKVCIHSERLKGVKLLINNQFHAHQLFTGPGAELTRLQVFGSRVFLAKCALNTKLM